MKKTLTLMVAFFLLSFYTGMAQNTEKNANNTNNDAQTVNKRNCGTMQHKADMEAADPNYALKMQQLEEFTENWLKNNPEEASKAIITVPVVVHIVYNTTAQNISDTRVTEQIAILNRDYAGLNTHSMGLFNTSLKANTELQFCLATKTNTGTATTGIERRQTSTSGFYTENNIKHYSTGGLDQWNANKYMNIWVGNLTGGLCGYAEFPTNPLSSTFGVVIHYQYFGLSGTANAPYHLGGTTTHEIGHCFNLYHVWGDDGGACNGSDNCNDTPNQADYCSYNTGWTGSHTDACTTTSPGIMYMNFMDYSDDAVYANFTPNQKSRITAAFAGSLSQLSTSAASNCSGVGITETDLLNNILIYPNPANDILNIDLSYFIKDVKISIYNSVGSLVNSFDSNNISSIMKIDLSSYKSGVYFVNMLSEGGNTTKKVSVVK